MAFVFVILNVALRQAQDKLREVKNLDGSALPTVEILPSTSSGLEDSLRMTAVFSGFNVNLSG